MGRAAIGVAIAGVALVWLAVRDHEAQGRLERLSDEVVALRTAVLQSQVPEVSPAMPSAARCGFDSTQIDAMARAVGLVLARAPSSASPPSNGPRDAGGEAPEDPEQEVATAHARDLVEAAIRRRTLTQDDVTQIRRELIAADSPSEAERLRLSIAAAINRGELVPQTRMMP
jgi:hypothetical protein